MIADLLGQPQRLPRCLCMGAPCRALRQPPLPTRPLTPIMSPRSLPAMGMFQAAAGPRVPVKQLGPRSAYGRIGQSHANLKKKIRRWQHPGAAVLYIHGKKPPLPLCCLQFSDDAVERSLWHVGQPLHSSRRQRCWIFNPEYWSHPLHPWRHRRRLCAGNPPCLRCRFLRRASLCWRLFCGACRQLAFHGPQHWRQLRPLLEGYAPHPHQAGAIGT